MLRSADLAIEVKARRLDGLRDLHDDLEGALDAEQMPVTVVVTCEERPLWIKEPVRREIVERTLALAKTGGGQSFTVPLDQPWASRPTLTLTIQIIEEAPLADGLRVFLDAGPSLNHHLADIESVIEAVLSDEQKVKQAEARPTVLVVDVARTGLGWIRPIGVWAEALTTRLPTDTPFIGVGAMFPRLTSADTEIALALRPEAPRTSAAALRELGARFGPGVQVAGSS